MGTVSHLRPERVRVGQVISWTYNDVIALRKDLTRQTTELGNAVALCATVNQQTRNEWRDMRQRVVDWLSDDPSWFRADAQYRRGEAIQKDLTPWYARLRSQGCQIADAPTAPSKPLGGFQFEGMGGIVLALVLAWALTSGRSNGSRR